MARCAHGQPEFPSTKALVVPGRADPAGRASRRCSALLAAPRPPSAVLCYNDIVAIGATRALLDRGMMPGKDIAIVGFDDIAEARDHAPPLTTISADTKQLGARCAESLLGLIGGEDPAGLSYAGKTRLIIRESCGAACLERKAS